MQYFLTFSQHFDRDKGLDLGRLVLRSIDEGKGKTHNVWIATSSTYNKQSSEDFNLKGGLIPPEYRCNIPCWNVTIKPIPMPNVVGVDGNFYQILPFTVTTDAGTVRGDFGIHLDSNAPGSLGCIVLDARRFKDFEQKMLELFNLGITQIPLFITYS
jgi:hypothetical protein